MSATSSIINNSQQRPPLQPRETPLDENGIKFTTPPDCTSSSLNTSVHNKRLNCDNFLNESENEPLKSLVNKRQRTKSGSDLMGSVDNNWNNSECCVRTDSSPLCERNYRNKTSKSDIQDVPIDNSKLCALSVDNQDKNVEVTKPVKDMDCKRFQNHSNGIVNGNFYNNVDNIEATNSNNGGLSPHCAATMEYVTQLPEGCTSSVKSCNIVTSKDSGHADSDDELEDDDNYLDSSEPEDNDLETCLLPLEEEESCGEGKFNCFCFIKKKICKIV